MVLHSIEKGKFSLSPRPGSPRSRWRRTWSPITPATAAATANREDPVFLADMPRFPTYGVIPAAS